MSKTRKYIEVRKRDNEPIIFMVLATIILVVSILGQILFPKEAYLYSNTVGVVFYILLMMLFVHLWFDSEHTEKVYIKEEK